MRSFVILVMTVLFLALSPSAFGAQGTLVLMGDGPRPAEVLEHVIELAGGDAARILIFPQASADPSVTAGFLANQLRDAGATSVAIIAGEGRALARPETLKLIEKSTALIFTGGDPARLMASFKDSIAMQSVQDFFTAGGLVVGFGAGAMVLPEKMITGATLRHRKEKDPFNYIQADNIVLQPGLGLIQGVILDDAFIRESRQNRLLSVVLEGEAGLGLGLADGTAVEITPSGTWKVLGTSCAVIYDARRAKGVRKDAAHNLRATGVDLHVLLDGDRFDPKPSKKRRR